MKYTMRSFLSGAAFGLLLFAISDFMPDANTIPMLDKLLTVAYFPAQIVNAVDSIIFWLAKTTSSNMDRGMGFDGGPLEWVEWLTVLLAMTAWYGFIFLLIAKTIEWKIRKNYS